MSENHKKPDGSSKSAQPPASLVWFEVPADNPERARKFYSSLFGWKINPFPGMSDYWHIETGGAEETPDGGLMARKHPGQPITQYILVPSVSQYTAEIEKLGGSICQPKMAVPQMGYLAICKDTEGNTFAIWEPDPSAK